MKITRRGATSVIGVCWVILGVGFFFIPDVHSIDDWFDNIRPWAWIITGAIAVVNPLLVHATKYLLVTMAVLVTERAAVFTILTLTGERPLGWYSAFIWLVVYLAPLFAAALPKGRLDEEE